MQPLQEAAQRLKPLYKVTLVKPNGTYFTAAPTTETGSSNQTWIFKPPVAGSYKVRVELSNATRFFGTGTDANSKEAQFNISIPKMTKSDLGYESIQQSFGSATSVGVSDVSSTSIARIDGDVTITGGDLTVEAKTVTGDKSADKYDPQGNQLETDKNNINVTAQLGSKKILLKTGKDSGDQTTRWWRSFANVGQKPTAVSNPGDKKEAPTKGPNLSGAVAVAISHDQADAIIGDNATIVVNDGNMTVNGYAEENIKVNVNAHVNKPSESVSGAAAVFVGDYNNISNAIIGDNAKVDVSGTLKVTANTVIPNQITLDDDWEEFKKKVNGFVDTGSWIEPFTKFSIELPSGSDSEAGVGEQIIQKIMDGTIVVAAQEKITNFTEAMSTGAQNYRAGITDTFGDRSTGTEGSKNTELKELLTFFPKLLENPNFFQKLSTTFVTASSKAGADKNYTDAQAKKSSETQNTTPNSGVDKSVAFSGSVNVFLVTNEANARIGDNAEINQILLSPGQDVIVKADSFVESINMTGLPSLNIVNLLLGRNTIIPTVTPAKTLTPAEKAALTPEQQRALKRKEARRANSALPIVGLPIGAYYTLTDISQRGQGRTAEKDLFERLESQLLFPTKSGGSGLGINFQQTTYSNTATATIGDNARVSSQKNVQVEAVTHNLLIDLTAAGGAAEGLLALTGAGTSTDIINTSTATIGDDSVVYARSNINVDADTDNVLVTYTGTTTKGATVGVGVSVTNQ